MFLLRRLVMSFIIVVLKVHTSFQIHLTIIMCLIILCYTISIQPFDTKLANVMEIFNEILVFLNTFFLLIYSDLVVEPHLDPEIVE